MAEQGRAFGIVEGALVSLANWRASGRDYYGFGHDLPLFGGGSRLLCWERVQFCCAYRIK